jgi:hypothetical protein
MMRRPMLEIARRRAYLEYLADRQRRALAEGARWLKTPLVIVGGLLDIGNAVRLSLLIRDRPLRRLSRALPKGVGGWAGNAVRIFLFGYRTFKRLSEG